MWQTECIIDTVNADVSIKIILKNVISASTSTSNLKKKKKNLSILKIIKL